MVKNKKMIFGILMLLITFCLVLVNCDNPGTSNNDIINNGNDSSNGENNGNKPLSDIIQGTWLADKGNLSLEFRNNIILFRQPWVGGDGRIVTYGNFIWISYDGTTIEVLDYDNAVVSFSGIISDNKLTVSGLSRIKWTAPPYQPRDFQYWNGTYTKENNN